MTWTGDERREPNPLLIEIHAMLKSHVQRFEDHVKLDDARELEQKTERKEIALRVLSVERQQGETSQKNSTTMWGFGIMLVLLQIALKLWK